MKVYTLLDEVQFCSELVILGGLYDDLHEARYNGLVEFCKSNIQYVDDPAICDCIVLPHKFKNTSDSVFVELCTVAMRHNKKLLCFYNDDDGKRWDMPPHAILFRTSCWFEHSKTPNVYGLPAFTRDKFNNTYLEPQLTIGYCGHQLAGREKYINTLQQSSLQTNFILRSHGLDGTTNGQFINEFHNNIRDNMFTFCYRGGGNFSYRFYEVLQHGRIPILVDTNCKFPFDDVVDINTLGVVIDGRSDMRDELNSGTHLLESNIDLVGAILDYYDTNKNNLLDIQHNNREIYQDYFSPIGFVDNIKRYIT